MEGTMTLSSLAQQEAAMLMRTDSLVFNMGLCIFYSSTRNAAGLVIRGLPASGTEGSRGISSTSKRVSDVGTELNKISHDGLDIFTDANEYLTKMRYASRSIARQGGPVSRICKDELS
jgi:hypothetical protein